MTEARTPAEPPPQPVLEIKTSCMFGAWLAEQRLSLALTTYQTGKIFLIGPRPDGRPRYVTAVSRSDVADGWRDKRRSSGVVTDVETGEIVAEGLSMPHSPRWYRDRLWLINSGTGFFGYVDLDSGKFVDVAFCPGFARGLDFIGDWAIVGLSDKRENKTFQDLDLEQNLKDREADTRAGLLVVNLKTGDSPHWLRFEGIVRELYDVAALPGIIRPMMIGFKSDEVRRYISFE